MKILGIGVDIVNNKELFLISNKSFINKTFGKNEIKFSKKINKINYFAKRFAAKESFANQSELF